MATRLNHRQLEAFRAVMLTGMVTRAAEMLYITQPAVTRLIADLEHAAGFALFERRKKRLVPTPEAHQLYAEVEKSFVSVDRIGQIAEGIRDFRKGSLQVASMPALALDCLPAVIGRFLTRRPDVTVSLQIRSSERVLEWLATQQYDIGFVATDATDAALDRETVLATRLVCVMPAGHRLTDRAVITPADLKGVPFVSLGPEQGIRLRIDSVFAEADVPLRRVVEAQLSAAACSLVLQGVGLSLVDPVAAAGYLDRGIEVRPFEPAIPFVFSVVHPRHRPRSRVAVEFLADVCAEMRENPLLQEDFARMDRAAAVP